MALAISTGFVVDDAIVVMENIVRLMEDGRAPDGRGSPWFGRNRTYSLVHEPVSNRSFIPILFMEESGAAVS